MEPLFDTTNTSLGSRYTLFPISPNEEDLYAMYKKAVASFWTVEEIDFSKDKQDWNKLNENEQYFIKQVLAFFAGSDGIVQENLATRFEREIQSPVARLFYAMQNAMEGIHCVVPETKILTDNGYEMICTLKDKYVKVWNGEEFSEVQVKQTSTNSKILKAILSNGMELECTEEHKWFIRKGNQNHPEQCSTEKIYTKDLKIGDVIADYEVPTIDIKSDIVFQNPYTHGFFCGDGSYTNKFPQISLYGDKQKLLPYLDVSSVNPVPHLNRTTCYLTGKISNGKYEVPLNCSINTKLEWLAGYVDADGCISKSKKGATAIQIVSVEKEFLQNVQLMLTTLGVKANIRTGQNRRTTMMPDGKGGYKEYQCRPTYVLYITHEFVKHLITLGFNPRRLKLNIDPHIKANRSLIRVVAIIDEGRYSETYCFNEPKRHAGVFNGILTGQSETYSLLIDQYVKDKDEKNKYFRAIDTFEPIRKKAQWAMKWINSGDSYATRLVGFACVEGIFFSGSFCAIFWVKKRGLLPGLTFSNELISRDEGLHTEFAVSLYHKLQNKLSEETIHSIIKDAVDIETEFICGALPCSLIGMNARDMKTYIQFVADRLVVQLGCKKIYNVQNPFDFMELISLEGKTNFFEKKVSEYSKPGVGMKAEDMEIRLDDEF